MRAAAILLLLLLAGLPDARAQEAADFLLRLRVSPEGPVTVNQRVTVTLTAMTPARFVDPPRWPDLAFTTGRAVVLPEADTVPGTERVGGQSYAALQRTYAVFPSGAGELVLAPLRMAVRVGGADGRPVAASATTGTARLAARVPPGVADVARLVVSPSLRLDATVDGVEGAAGEVRVGQAVTRHLRLSAEDTTAMLLPPAIWGAPEGVRVYPDPPAVQDRTERGTLHAERSESAAYVPQRAGEVVLPGFGLDWFDPGSGRLRQLTVEPIRLTVLPAAGAPAAAGPLSLPAWAWAAAGLVLLAACGGWLARRRARRGPSPLAGLAAACRANDPRAAVPALYRWADGCLPAGGERRVARLAAITGVAELAAEAAALEARVFGGPAARGAWRGAPLLAAARHAERALGRRGGPTTRAPLPPLNPPGAMPAPGAARPRLAQPRWAR